MLLKVYVVDIIEQFSSNFYYIKIQVMMVFFIHMISIHFNVVEFYFFIHCAMKYRGRGVKMAHIIKCDAS